MSPLVITLLLCLAQTDTATAKTSTFKFDVSQDAQSVAIAFDSTGTSLADFVQAASRALGWSLQYQPDDLKEGRLFATAPLTIPAAELASYVHNVLRGHDLIIVTLGDGPAALRRVVRISGVTSRPGMLKSVAPFISADDILAGKAQSAPLVTTQLTLKHANARELATSMTGYFADQLVESVRNVEDTNALVITGWVSTVRGVLKLANEIDQMAAAPAPPRPEKKLEPRVVELEKRLAAMEEELGRRGQSAAPGSPPSKQGR